MPPQPATPSFPDTSAGGGDLARPWWDVYADEEGITPSGAIVTHMQMVWERQSAQRVVEAFAACLERLMNQVREFMEWFVDAVAPILKYVESFEAPDPVQYENERRVLNAREPWRARRR